MTNKEVKIYRQAVKEKYKHYTLWKVLAIIFMVLTAVFASMYFCTGDLFRKTEVVNNVEINNEGDGNENNVTISNQWQ